MIIYWDSVGSCNVFSIFHFPGILGSHVRVAIENDILDLYVNPFTIFYCGPNFLSLL